MCIANDLNACNAHEFPENRRKCIRCDSVSGKCPTHDEPESVQQYSVYCKNVTDSCAIIDRGVDVYLQTCASEMADNDRDYCQSHQAQCTFCSGINNCNLKQFQPTAAPPTTEPTTTNPKDPPSSATQSNGNHLLLIIFIIISTVMT